MAEAAYITVLNHVKFKVDPRIKYPSYKSFDEFIDVARLKSLDQYLSERLQARLERQDTDFYISLTQEPFGKRTPGSKTIHLTKATRPYSYREVNDPDLWEIGENAAEFPLLLDFVATLPFKRTARVVIMYDFFGNAVTAHRDHPLKDLCHEFIWFRTNLKKPFYLLNPWTNEKEYVRSYSAWFDTVNQLHGADKHEGPSFTIRVDGLFSDQLRKQITTPAYNLSSTAALWAATSQTATAARSNKG
jgi:hypothetical protein